MPPQASTSVLGSILPSSTTSPPLMHELTATATATAPSSSLVTFADDHMYYNVLAIVSNCISILACIAAVALYILLRRKDSRLMTRTSLKISVAMICTDLLFHVSPHFVTSTFCTHYLHFCLFQASNLASHGKPPEGFACAFVGGWLFAFPGMLSIFYACAIALNTQLVFVHGRTVKENRQALFLVVPVVLTLLISTFLYSCSYLY